MAYTIMDGGKNTKIQKVLKSYFKDDSEFCSRNAQVTIVEKPKVKKTNFNS